MKTKKEIVSNWLPRYTGIPLDKFGRHILLVNFEAYLHVARASEGRARVLLDTYSGDARREVPLQAVLSHPRCAFMTDTILTLRGKANPASYGTFPRILGRYSRVGAGRAVGHCAGYAHRYPGGATTQRLEPFRGAADLCHLHLAAGDARRASGYRR